MISADIQFEGFDARSWTNLISLFNPDLVERIRERPSDSDDPTTAAFESAPNLGTLAIIVDETDEVLKAFHTVRGRVKDFPGFESADVTGELPALTRAYNARRTVVIREGAMEEIVERLSLRLCRGDDYLAQWLVLMRIFREMQETDDLRIYPRPLARMPVPSLSTVTRALNIVLPDEKCLLVVVWHGTTPFTCFAVRRREGQIDRVVGPDLIFRWTGPLGGDWRRDHRVIVDAVSRSVAPVHLGLFSEARTLRHLLRDGERGAWARAMAVRDVIFHPTPAYVAAAVGADAVRAGTSYAARLLGDLHLFDALGLGGNLGEWMMKPSTIVRNQVNQIASVTSTLGFNPLSALSALMKQREEDDSDADESE